MLATTKPETEVQRRSICRRTPSKRAFPRENPRTLAMISAREAHGLESARNHLDIRTIGKRVLAISIKTPTLPPGHHHGISPCGWLRITFVRKLDLGYRIARPRTTLNMIRKFTNAPPDVGNAIRKTRNAPPDVGNAIRKTRNAPPDVGNAIRDFPNAFFAKIRDFFSVS
jgi:hypothetical protein